MKKLLVSIVIPVKEINDYIRNEVIPSLEKQTFKNFELIVLPDKKTKEKLKGARIIPTWPKTGPADKRDLGVKKAKGEIISFLDDDAYPVEDWLKEAVAIFNTGSKRQQEKIAGVCGPGVTPENDSFLSKVSGWMWASFLGSGGAGTYRCWPSKKQEVDDFPTFNLLVKKDDFNKVGGFDSRFWPGEDTKLGHDLVYKLNKKIIYDPKVLVYHHRRDVLIPHLKQIGRYGLHRGFFVKALPKTSRRIGYFMPSLFLLGLIFGLMLLFLFKAFSFDVLRNIVFWIYISCISFYALALLITGAWVFLKSRNIFMGILVMPVILISHLFNGLMFLKGFLKKDLKSKYSKEKI